MAPDPTAIERPERLADDRECPCCAGTGQISPDERPLCGTAVQRRDRRSPDQRRRFARLQQLALTGIAFDDGARLLPEHDREFIDYRSDGEVRV